MTRRSTTELRMPSSEVNVRIRTTILQLRIKRIPKRILKL